LPPAVAATYPEAVPPPSAPLLIAAGLLLGVVAGWVAGLVRVRTP